MDTSNGYNIKGQAAQDTSSLPIFDVEKVELQFSTTSDFVAAQVANNVLILALQTGRILRIDLDNAGDIDDIDLPRKPQEIGVIKRMFLDPTASHLIVSTTLGENFYLHTQSRQPKPLSRLKGIPIESVSWNPSQPTASTREILVGASDGNIYETYIEVSAEFYKREEKYLKRVYSVEGPVTGLYTDLIPGKLDLRRILVSTPGRLLHFLGRLGRQGQEGSGSIYTKLFESDIPTIHETSAGASSRSSALAVTPEGPGTPLDASSPERIFAWLSSQGVLHSKLLTSPATPELGHKIFSEARILTASQLPASKSTTGRQKGVQESASLVALTQWHIIQFVENRVVAFNRLDDSLVYDQLVLSAGQRAIALLADMKKNTFWLFTTQEVFEIVVRDEGRDVWKVMLKAQNFGEALQYANSAAQKDAVATASGDYLIKKGQFMEAAGVYGKSSKPFEQVALAFIDQGQKDALRNYLSVKLSTLRKSAVMQRIMLASWLTEIFMSKLNSLDDMLMTKAELAEDKTPADIKGQLLVVRREFQDFVSRYKASLDRKTIYDIISSHGREQELLYFATTIDDHNYVLAYWVQRENWPEALKALNRQTDPEIAYKYGSVLMSHVAVDFIDILMRQSNLNPRKLIPAFLNYNQMSDIPLSQNQAVRYLLFEINHRDSTDSAIHNTLLSIYASHPSRDESSLLAYLESQSPTTIVTSTTSRVDILQSLPYDADFALRLCIQHVRIHSCIHIYTRMGQYASAVSLALQHQETDLAISVAERPEHDAALRKKLWLSIARSVIASPAMQENSAAEGKSDTTPLSTALSLLRRAPPNTLRIEDLLPFLPDFIRIDALKPEICAALESYSASIDSLKQDMDASAATSARIKEETQKLGRRWVLLEPGEACAVCGEVLLERRFWVWGCGHGCHGDCAGRAVERWGAKATAKRIKDIRRLVEIGGIERKRRDALVKELDELVGASCPVCGDLAIRMVDEPFVGKDEDVGSWAL